MCDISLEENNAIYVQLFMNTLNISPDVIIITLVDSSGS